MTRRLLLKLLSIFVAAPASALVAMKRKWTIKYRYSKLTDQTLIEADDEHPVPLTCDMDVIRLSASDQARVEVMTKDERSRFFSAVWREHDRINA